MRSERGIALVTVILVVALATTVAAFIAWRQQVWTRQVENLRDAAQAEAVARAGVDWARAILDEDGRDNGIDHLGEDWAQPVLVPVERGQATGALTDLQGRFNLNNLVRDGEASASDRAAFQRLLTLLGLDAGLADALLDWLDADGEVSGQGGGEDAWYLARDPPAHPANRPLVELAELARVRGFDAEVIARLAPHVTALPEASALNPNTATPEALAALLPALTLDAARALARELRDKPCHGVQELRERLGAAQAAGMQDGRFSVASHYYQAGLQVEFGRVRQGWRALIRRAGEGWPALVWMRPE